MKQLQVNGVLFAGATVALMVSQPVLAAITTVTSVRLDQTARGLNVVLLTSTGDRPQVLAGTQGNALVTDIINTQLRLPQRNSFRQDNPAPGIVSVVITQFAPNTIRVVVTGTTSAPTGQVAARNAQGLTLSFTPPSGTTALSPPAAPTTPPAQPQPSQTPNVLVPNPQITIDGTTAPGTAPPLLPRAIAPPAGDIAVSNTDSSPSTIDLGTDQRVPRLVLREAPVREVLALLARAAGLNLVYTVGTNQTDNFQQPQPIQGGANQEGPTISLDVENESVQDVFNYVLRISNLQANRNGRTILVSTRLPNPARDVIVRSLRLNQVTVGVALNFLAGFGAETAVSRERVITSVTAVPVGGSTTPAQQTTQTTEQRIETQRINFQDALPLLRGLQALGDERTNSITLVGTPKQVDLASAQLTQLDLRRRQVAVNVKIIDVSLSAIDDINSSLSFGIGRTFFSTGNLGSTTNTGGIVSYNTTPAALGQFDRRLVASLSAQIQNGNAKILTDPTLIVQEGQAANINLTQEVIGNVITQINATAGTSFQTVTAQKQQVGLTVTIRIERIDDNGFVSLQVAPTVSAPQQTVTLNLGANSGSQTITLINQRSLTSGVIRLRDSQTLVLSGIIQDTDRATVSKVPFLGDIPLLGALFRRTNKQNQRQEVIVLLTPQILDDSERATPGYNYTPSPDVRRILEQGGLRAPKKPR